MPAYVEIGNVYTRAMLTAAVPTQAGERWQVVEHITPTTVYRPAASPEVGLGAVLGRLAEPAGSGPVPGGDHIALLHLYGLPRSAVIGLAGLTTTELTIHSIWRQAGSSVVQVKSSDTANLEAQLIEVRARALDLLVFAGPARHTAERLMAGGGPRPRVLPRLQAIYNGPLGEHSDLNGLLGPGVELSVVAPVRTDSSRVDIEPTEEALRNLTDVILAADPLAQAARQAGFDVWTFARAFSVAAQQLAGVWSGGLRPGTGGGPQRGSSGVPGGVMLIDLGGRYTEMALSAGGPASRLVLDFSRLEIDALTAPPASGRPGRAARVAESGRTSESLAVGAVGRWLPYDWTTAGLGDQLANYLRRPFLFPSTWSQLLTLLALARERLAIARTSFRAAPGVANLDGDWRRATGLYVLSGGAFRYLPGPALALIAALDGLEPTGFSEIWCDRHGQAPYLAAAGRLAAVSAESFAERLATVVAPLFLHLDWRRPHEDDILALVTVVRAGGESTTFRIVPGSLVRYPLLPGERARLTVHPMRQHDFGAGPGAVWQGEVTGGRLGLVFDSRGRPVALPADAQVRQAKLREWVNTLGGATPWEVGGA